ncbi:MAG TPA: response regulator [Acholeplasmataceae bacterium]|nr:response regulator [Acholeplasmataceae bacterium]
MKKFDLVYIVREGVLVPKINKCKTLVFNNVIEGLQAIKLRPHVVFIDLGLTRVTGIDCLKMIRSNPLNHQIKIVVCSKKYNLNLLQKSFAMGADFYIGLPFDEGDIKTILHEISKNMKYFSLEDVITYTPKDTLAYQNHDVDI